MWFIKFEGVVRWILIEKVGRFCCRDFKLALGDFGSFLFGVGVRSLFVWGRSGRDEYFCIKILVRYEVWLWIFGLVVRGFGCFWIFGLKNRVCLFWDFYEGLDFFDFLGVFLLVELGGGFVLNGVRSWGGCIFFVFCRIEIGVSRFSLYMGIELVGGGIFWRLLLVEIFDKVRILIE